MTAGIDFDPAEREAIASEMNLSVLKRSDPAIQLVLKSASHVVLYRMREGTPEWTRCEIEGSLFIVERSLKKGSYPDRSKHRIVIINRKSPENYSDNIVVGNKELERNDKMIMYNNPNGSTMGIWFYEVDEAAAVFDLLQKIVNGQSVAKPSPTRPKRVNRRSATLKNAGKPRIVTAVAPTTQTVNAKESAPPVHADEAVNPLERFFPDLKLTDGVAGEAVPENAQESSEFEKNGARPPETKSTTEAAIVKAPPAGIPDVSTIESNVQSGTETKVENSSPTNKASANKQTDSARPNKTGKQGGKSSGRPAVRAGSGTSEGDGKEQDEAQRMLQAQAMLHAQTVQMQEARMREMQYRFGNGDMGGPQGGGMMGGQAGVPVQHFGGGGVGGVHPQMAMMMHPMHQMYMHQYMANVQQQQRHMQLQSEEECAKDLMRMLKVEQGEHVGSALVAAGMNEELGGKGEELDRVSFRAVIQRMLTDRKLFDSVYQHYVRSVKGKE